MFASTRRRYSRPGRASFALANFAAAWLFMFQVRAAESARPPVPIRLRPLDAGEASKISYSRQIKPILINNCLECHSTEERKSQFEITSVETLRQKGKKAGPGIVAGKPDESAIVQYIAGVHEPQMPKGAPPLSEDELHLIRLWILGGAKDDSNDPSAKDVSAESAAQKVKSLAQLPKDAASEKLINALLFSESNEELLVLRREVRLAKLPPAPHPPEVNGPVFNPIDQFIAARWKTAGLPEARQAPALCSDQAFARRVYLDLTGLIPTAQEAQAFLSDPDPEKRTKLIDQLLNRKEDYAAHWTPFWEDALASATTDSTGGIPTHGNYREWIYKNFLTNKPYDVMVAELIDPTMPGHKKAGQSNANGKISTVAYIRNDTHVDTIQSAANTAQVFLGTGMKCASCHSHFENKEWPQARFLAFAGLFAPKDLELIRCEKHSGQYVPSRFAFDLPDAPMAVPAEEEARLHRLAQLLVDPTNPRFAQTLVNRLWKRYLGLGLFEPADDFRLERPASHPELLAWLADDFMRHGFDLKHTIRLILTSRTYQLRYNPAVEDHFDVGKPGEPRYVRSPTLRRLTAEQFLDSIRLATTGAWNNQKRAYLDKTSTALTRALGRPASRSEVSTARPDDVAVVQALELLNGNEFAGLVYSGELLDNLAASPQAPDAVRNLYWTALSRDASAQELAVGTAYLEKNAVHSSPSSLEPREEVWLDDAVPEGVKMEGSSGTNSWKWVGRDQGPVFSGEFAHTQGGTNQPLQHSAIGAKQALTAGPRDILFTYVYLDPENPPKEIMLQWNQGGTWEHRAYWGEDSLKYGTANSAARRPMGPFPKTGEWTRLEVPLREVDLRPGEPIAGWSFDQVSGLVYWDKAGAVHKPRDQATEAVGDILWALFTGPEFQYIK